VFGAAGEAGTHVGGRYRLLEAVGQGGMGRVWRAHDEALDRTVAVKELVCPAGTPEEVRRELVGRARREAMAAARLQHRGVVRVHDVVDQDSTPWLVMEFIAGQSLAALLAARGPLEWRRVAALGAEVADALAHAHEAGIVHRDLKPGNILLTDHRVLLTDFGIARVLDATTRLTSTGTVLGTPQYMSPEQLAGLPVGPPGDLWSLGATLYAAIAGGPPFDRPSLAEVCAAILEEPAPRSERAGPLAPVLAELLTKQPERRPDARTVAQRLRAIADAAPAAQPPHVPGAPGAPAAPGTATSDPATFPLTPAAAPVADPAARSGPSRRALLLGGAAALTVGAGGYALYRVLRQPGPQLWLTLTGHTGAVNSVSFSADGSTVASAGADRTVRLWNLTAKGSSTVLSGQQGEVRAVAFGPDSRLLAGARDNAVVLWDTGSTQEVGRHSAHTNVVTSLAFRPGGRSLVSGSTDQTVRVWDLNAADQPTVLTGAQESVLRVACSRNGRVAASGDTRTVHVWDLASSAAPPDSSIQVNQTPTALALAQDGSRLLTGDAFGTVAARPVGVNGSLDFLYKFGAVTCLAACPSGPAFAGGGTDHTIAVQFDDNRCTTLSGHTDAVTSLAFSPDGRRLASGGADGTVRIWQLS
jgi:WD40 repeat protein